PQPHVADGRLMEPHWDLGEADRSALEAALCLRDEAAASVTIQVAAVGPRGCTQALRESLSLGADRVRLVVSEAEAVSPDRAAAALAAALGEGSAFDLVLSGSGAVDDEDGLVGRLTAEALGVAYAGKATHLAVRKTDDEADVLLSGADGRQQRVRPLAA